MRVLRSLTLTLAVGALGAIPAFAQDSNTTCTTLYNTTHCSTSTIPNQPNGGSGRGFGAFVDSFSKGWDAAQRLAERRAMLRQQRLQIEQQEALVEQQRQLARQQAQLGQTQAPATASPFAANPDPKAPFTLACRFSIGTATQDQTFYVQPALGLVGQAPGVVTDTTIQVEGPYQAAQGAGQQKTNHTLRVTISRINGAANVAYDGSAVGTGTCARAAVRAF
jgi:hypothetical protein